MLKIRVICIGKTKEHYIQEKIDEYIRGLQSNVRIEYIEIKKSKNPDKVASIKQDYKNMEQYFDRSRYRVLLDSKGKQYDSLEFAYSFIGPKLDIGQNIDFYLAGPFGLRSEDKSRFDSMLSLSKMTYTHQIARVILIEQIYRAFSILTGKKYHY